MAFGKHWEWRGFGRINDDLRGRIEALAPLFASDRALADTYLWTPHRPVNIKLRLGDLKFKRLLASDGELECWQEDENELYPFPLDAAVVEKLGRDLAITVPGQQQTPVGRSELLALLENAHPPVQILRVEKQRRLFSLPIRRTYPVIVELTEIIQPERITTVALEHGEIEIIRQAWGELNLPDQRLRSQNYLQTLSAWARGERISQE